MADIERSVEIEQIDYNVDINNVSYSIDILPQNTYTIELNKQGPQGLRGYTGNGIESYELTSTAGLVDTYTITFTDGDTKTVDVTNGADGTSAGITSVTATVDSNVGIPSVDVALGGTELSRTIEFDFHNLKGQPGQDGVDGVDGRDGEAATISVGTVTTGLPTDPASVTNVGTSSAAIFDFTIPKGEKGDKGDQGVQGVKGDTGNGVSGVSLLSTVGLVDTYRMSFTNGTYFDYPVKNGQDGTGSVSDVTVNGISVLDGTIAKIDLTDYVTTSTAQTITARKTFTGEKAINFKQNSTTDRLGFTMFNNENAERGYLEYNPSNLVDNVPLMTLGNYATSTSNITHVGFRKYDGSNRAAYNLLAPLAANAKTPFSLSNVYKNFYLPLGFTDGNTTVLTSSNGVVDISSLLPSGGAVDSVNGQTGDVVLTASDVGALPDTTVIPTKTSDLTNDSGFTTSSDFKTINNTSIVGSGNIDTSEIFIATYGTTTYAEVLGARTNGKNVICKVSSGSTTNVYYPLIFEATSYGAFEFSGTTGLGAIEVIMLDSTNNWSASTTYPANTSLSNLLPTGQKVIDGQWVNYSATIAENVSLNGGTELEYTLSGLPADSNYEVLLSGVVNTGNVSGNSAQVNIHSDLLTNYISLCGAGTRANGVVQSRGSVILPVSSTMKIYVGRGTNNNGTFALYVRGYRRIGTNT